MSLKLLEFPVVPLTDIPARLRLLAEQIEDGEFGEVQNVTCAVETEEMIRPLSFGLCSDPIRLGGVFLFAATAIQSADE